MSNSLQVHGQQCTRLLCPSLPASVFSHSCSMSQWCYPTISFSVAPSPPTLNLSQDHRFFQWVRTSHQVVDVLELQLQHQSFQWIFRIDLFRTDWFDLLAIQRLSRIFCSTIIWKHQFFSDPLLSGPIFTSIYDYWKNHTIALFIYLFVYSFVYIFVYLYITSLCWQSDVSAFEYAV